MSSPLTYVDQYDSISRFGLKISSWSNPTRKQNIADKVRDLSHERRRSLLEKLASIKDLRQGVFSSRQSRLEQGARWAEIAALPWLPTDLKVVDLMMLIKNESFIFRKAIPKTLDSLILRHNERTYHLDYVSGKTFAVTARGCSPIARAPHDYSDELANRNRKETIDDTNADHEWKLLQSRFDKSWLLGTSCLAVEFRFLRIFGEHSLVSKSKQDMIREEFKALVKARNSEGKCCHSVLHAYERATGESFLTDQEPATFAMQQAPSSPDQTPFILA